MENAMIYGYGYRNNCFGSWAFYEDSMYLPMDMEATEKLLKKVIGKTRKELYFSFKVCTDSGKTWAVDYNEEEGLFEVNYSEVWNITDTLKMNFHQVFKTIMRGLQEV